MLSNEFHETVLRLIPKSLAICRWLILSRWLRNIISCFVYILIIFIERRFLTFKIF